jgi:outer membrane protein insertion porin family
MTDRAGQLGYAFADVEPVVDINQSDLTVDLTFRIDEGPRVYVERIEIIGNVRTLDEVIRREFRLAEGDAYNLALLRRSEQRVRNLGFFESVNVRTARGSAPDRVVIVTRSPRHRPASCRSAPASRPRTGLWATFACPSATSSVAARV